MIESHKMIRHRVRQRWIVAASSVVFVGVGLAGCGGSKTTENTLVYGLEAETDAGWCLSEGQLALSGMQIAKAIYDPLTMPDDEGIFRPWLAKSVEPNADYTKWTIELREGVEFHDGTALTAEVVKNNIDSYRGQYKGRPPSLGLLTFVYNNIGTTTVTGPLTLEVTTLTPWPSFPAYLNANNRFGVMAQAQLDASGNWAALGTPGRPRSAFGFTLDLRDSGSLLTRLGLPQERELLIHGLPARRRHYLQALPRRRAAPQRRPGGRGRSRSLFG